MPDLSLNAINWAGLEQELYSKYNMRVAKMLGQGGFGRAYLVVDASGADKVVKFDTTSFGSTLASEYEKMEWLRHPNIPRLYNFLSFGGGAINAYEMDFCRSGDLFQVIEAAAQRRSTINVIELPRLFKGILCALSHLHSFNVVHRDVKPPNVLFDHGMKPFLADFGMATGPSAVPVTYNERAGTEGFMAPEMLAHKFYGTPADVWSFNRVVHATVTGDPHGGTDLDEHSVLPWIWRLHSYSGHDDPHKRMTAAQLHKNVVRVLAGEEVYTRIGSCSASKEAGGVWISDMIRSMGTVQQQMLKRGRAAEKRISSKLGTARTAASDARARNASRKARRKVAKAVVMIGANRNNFSAADVLEYIKGGGRGT